MLKSRIATCCKTLDYLERDPAIALRTGRRLHLYASGRSARFFVTRTGAADRAEAIRSCRTPARRGSWRASFRAPASALDCPPFSQHSHHFNRAGWVRRHRGPRSPSRAYRPVGALSSGNSACQQASFLVGCQPPQTGTSKTTRDGQPVWMLGRLPTAGDCPQFRVKRKMGTVPFDCRPAQRENRLWDNRIRSYLPAAATGCPSCSDRQPGGSVCGQPLQLPDLPLPGGSVRDRDAIAVFAIFWNTRQSWPTACNLVLGLGCLLPAFWT